MKSHNYPGLDYSGPGSTANRDPETGIRYGVISQNSIQPDYMSDIWTESTDLSYGAAVAEAKKELVRVTEWSRDEWSERFREVIKNYSSDNHIDSLVDDLVSQAEDSNEVEALWSIVSDEWGDRYESGDSHDWLWEKDGYRLENCLQADVFISKSPYYTYAQFCSPCVPGACNLDSPFEGLAVPSGRHASFAEDFGAEAEAIGYVKCFCLGHDFFDEGKAPYEVFEIATGKRVLPEPAH